ncbi:hypothetical protein BCSAG_48740 [Bacillus cereus]|uniref:hypothetical protein n=1 Tax=Bacillus TaxID=1386 RepID=UPI0015CF2427|nr:hypothetical protein [Bacillus thuringiensis]HDR7263687.1 hypothetical protein [Bacillus cereus]HDX9663366.1 hypothetical protein [Bacillus cereus]
MDIKQQLLNNFAYVQNRIDEIQQAKNIDIKQISDLQRYTEMQKNITYSLFLLRGEK